MMTNGESTKIVNFMILGEGVLVLGRSHVSHIVQMHYFSKIFATVNKDQTN